MFKKRFLLIPILLLFIIIIFYQSAQTKTNEEAPLPSIQTEELAPEEEEEEETTDDKTEEEPITEQVKDFITDAVQRTIEMFRHKHYHIVAIGDSLTQGVGDESNNGGYVGIIEEVLQNNEQPLEVTFENFGKRGNRTDQLLKRMEDPEIRQSLAKADIILITIGANDIMEVFKQNITQLTIEPFQQERIYFEQRLQQIFTEMRKENKTALIYLLGIYNPFAQYFEDIEELEMIVNDWNETSYAVAHREENSAFIPIKDLFEDSEEHLFADDNFHPNQKGYERMAERVLDYLVEQEE